MKIHILDCSSPEKCCKCVQVCPMNVLVLKPTGTKKMSPIVKKWKVKAVFKNMCNGCNKCMGVCSDNYIKIELW